MSKRTTTSRSCVTSIPSASAAGAKDNTAAGFLTGVRVFFIENGLGKTRTSILAKQLERHGGVRDLSFSGSTGHLVAAKHTKFSKILSILKVAKLPSRTVVVNADWLTDCFKDGRLISVGPYLITDPSTVDVSVVTELKSRTDDKVQDHEVGSSSSIGLGPCGVEPDSTKEEKNLPYFKENKVYQLVDDTIEESGKPLTEKWIKRSFAEASDSSYENSEEYDDAEYKRQENKKQRIDILQPVVEKPRGNWVCTKPSSSRGTNFNEHITSKLEILSKEYKNTQDKWRALGYQKAIGSIKNFHKKLETFEEISRLPFVGERLAKKIWEIVETGHLRRLDHTDPKMDAINLFSNVWGAGAKTAETWVTQGYRTLEDLEKNATLNFQQKIGLKYYHEFLDRMPRSEVEEIEAVVRAKAREVSPDFELVTCGSYRRGRTTCGDIDILLSHPDGKSHEGALSLILDKLKAEGYITDDLITTDKERQKKYMGVFLLQGANRKHRRIDIIVSPYDQFPCALVHFTGSGHLNRSMRQLAKTKGMSLSEHALRTNVIRKVSFPVAFPKRRHIHYSLVRL